MLKKLLEEFKTLGIILFLLVAVFFVGRCQGINKTEDEYGLILNQNAYDYNESIKVTETEKLKLSDLLAESKAKEDSLQQIIAQMKVKPSEIRYITRTETVVIGSETVQQTCPENYLFALECGMPVAEIKKTGTEYRLSTASLAFETKTVIAEGVAATKLTAKSTLEPETIYELPTTNFQIFEQKEFKVIKPELSLIGSTHFPLFSVSAGLGMPWLHIIQEVDLASPRLTVNGSDAYIGIDIASYNIGKPIPLINNIWVGAGVSLSTSLDKSIDISISSKL